MTKFNLGGATFGLIPFCDMGEMIPSWSIHRGKAKHYLRRIELARGRMARSPGVRSSRCTLNHDGHGVAIAKT